MRSLAGLGAPSLMAALSFALLAGGLAIAGVLRSNRGVVIAARRAMVACFAFVAIATASLLGAIVAHDFSYSYVARYSSQSLDGAYLIGTLWGGMEGSLLFWTLLLTGFAAFALTRSRIRDEAVIAWAAAVLAGVAAFFLLLLVAPASPFARLFPSPADGNGLNPLLQSPGMLIHPPLLYTGFVGFSIPFAFAMGALLTGRLDDSWFTSTRRWTLFAWSALSIGIVLGGAWAYTELGWGGYWAWDPVENASFMPWLTATAFLHSVVIQEKRRMLKVWNVTLILLTYVLAVFGTFLTRSGILSSIHTFTEGPIGKWFLPFLGVMLVGGLGVVVARLDRLRAENRYDSVLSRESAFLINNVLFVAAALAVFWGTIYPIVAEVVTGVRLSVGPPFFNSVFVPIALAILALTGIGPLISWRKMRVKSFVATLRAPLAAGSAVVIALAVLGVRSVGALLAFGLCGFTATALFGEFVRGGRLYKRSRRAPWPVAIGRAIGRNKRRYGGYVVHLGVVLIAIGFAGSAFKTERHALLSEGESMRVGSYELTYAKRTTTEDPEKQSNIARVIATRGGDEVATLYPQRNFHFAQRQPQSEVAIRSTPVEDLYVVVTSFDADGDAALRAFVNPLTWWIWVGAGVMLSGMAILLSSPAPVRAAEIERAEIRSPAVATP
ncbi:MAG TPA: heme lyase CcmF/NrfE family subunit [Actinomycetota bacterium]|nr:heme lyase CcmF/NrfE family subunit [Actinomycetota bacterium]